jgi:hypothetical protein
MNNPKKKVKFNIIVKVILVPSKNEYYQNHLEDKIWWSLYDIDKFKLNYRTHILTIMNLQNVDVQNSLKILNK